MIYNDLLRQLLLALTGAIFLLFTGWAVMKPRSLASALGYEINSANAASEFHAIYVGIFFAQALLCTLAISRVYDATIGDMVAIFVLSQPVGRFIVAIRTRMPSGFTLLLLIAELVGGILLVIVRPTG